MTTPKLISNVGHVPESPARVDQPSRTPFRIGLVQERWHPDPVEHESALSEGVRTAAGAGAELVCLQELTLSRYFAVTPEGPTAAGAQPEPLPGGRTHAFAAQLASELGVHVHASLYEDAGDAHRTDDTTLGFNTAIVVAPDGELVARTRKLHIPVTAGYYEDRYFRPGDTGFPVVALGDARPRLPHLLGPVVPRARARVLARRRRRDRLPPPRSARNPTIPTSTPSRSGNR